MNTLTSTSITCFLNVDGDEMTFMKKGHQKRVRRYLDERQMKHGFEHSKSSPFLNKFKAGGQLSLNLHHENQHSVEEPNFQTPTPQHISRDDTIEMEEIGKGSSGYVLKCLYVPTLCFVAVSVVMDFNTYQTGCFSSTGESNINVIGRSVSQVDTNWASNSKSFE